MLANVFLGRELYKGGPLGRLGILDHKEMRTMAIADLERVGIASVQRDVRVSALSGGQRQAVAIGRTVAWGRKLILLDESQPTTSACRPSRRCCGSSAR